MKPCCFYLEGPCFINRTLALAISFLLLLFNCVTLQAATVPNPVSSLPGRQVFKSIPLFPVEKRIESAVAFYKKYYRKAPAAVAMSGLDDLNGIAVKLDDKSLQCAVYWLRADYYSVNSLFNKLGISYYQDGINFARKNMLPVEIAISVHKMGMYYATFKHNATAYSYLLNANKMFKDIGFNKVPEITTYLNDLAVFYYNIGDFYNAKIQLTEALKYKTYTKRQEISMINSIGLIYRINREYDQAIDYFNKSLQLAKLSRDSAWIGIAQGNIGSAYLMQNNFKRALPYIRTDYTVSLKYAEVANAAIAMLRMVRISMNFHELKLADRELDTVRSLLVNQRDVLNQWIDYYELKAERHERAAEFTAALKYRKLLEAAKDSLTNRNNIQDFERMGLRRLMDLHVAQVNELKTDERIGYVKRNAVIIVLFLLVIIFVLVYNRRLLKQKKDKALLLAEKRVVDGKLKSSILELTLYTESIKQQNVIIEKFKARLQNLQDNKSYADKIEKMMAVSLMTDINWNEFRKLFIKVHSRFFIDLKINFPLLSETDVKLLTLMKLQLNNSEMAGMLSVTIEGIKKAKQRLRKKMALPDKEGIEEFVISL